MLRRRPLALIFALLILAGCQTGLFGMAAQRQVVFFTEDSSTLNENGRAIVTNAAAVARANRFAQVTVLGFASPAGGVDFNQALSDARARHVADALVENGVSRSRITVRARGPVPFDLIPTESRRVEIVVGG
jgi:outer membrane protein OmpA-like peptidoglycan-associated protein